jgi:hypothetical protein
VTYKKELPAVRELLSLSQHTIFPAKRDEIMQIALKITTQPNIVDFLKLFPPDTTFRSRVNFMTVCEELELLIGQERLLPSQRLRSP